MMPTVKMVRAPAANTIPPRSDRGCDRPSARAAARARSRYAP
jgi:hypothetical protein